VAACELLINYTCSNKAHLVRAINASGNNLLFEGQIIRENKTLAILGDLKMKARIGDMWEAAGGTGDELHAAQQL
jgi:hypothetical protein